MSQIEKLEGAIVDLLNARNADSLTEYPKNETLDIAIQAMKEKLERETCYIHKYIEGCEECGFCESTRRREPGGWIKCSERLPDDDELILAYHPHYLIPSPGHEHEADKITIKFGWYCRKSDLGITHWMPLPEPPKEERI